MKQRIWAWVRTLGGVGILAVLLWRLGSSAFLDGLRVINVWTLLAAFGIGLLATVASAWRWRLAARGLGIKLPLRRAVADYYQALFLNATLPGGLLGDVHRAVSNGRDNGDVGRGVRAVVLERFAGQVVMFAVGLGVVIAHPGILLFVARRVPVPALVVAGALVLAAGVAIGVRPQWRRRAGAVVSDVRLGLLAKRNWIGVGFSSAVVVASHVGTFVLAARAVGSTAPLGQLLSLGVLALIVMVLPLSVGGWGPREGFCAWAFGAAGLGANEGLTIAVVYGLFALVAALPGIGVLAVRILANRRAGSAALAAAAVPAAAASAVPAAAVPAALAVPAVTVPVGDLFAHVSRADSPASQHGDPAMRALDEFAEHFRPLQSAGAAA